MADDSFRNQRGDALTRGIAAAQRDGISDDPLAELARLIGQSDPQSPPGRLAGPPAEAADEAAPPALDWSAQEQDHGEQGEDLQQNFAPPRPSFPQFPAAEAAWPRHANGDNEPRGYSPPAALFEDAIAAARQVDGYSDELVSGITGSQAFPYFPPAHDDNASDEQYQPHGFSDAEADPAEEYQGVAAYGRRRAAVVIVAVLGVVVAGTAGALGYHAMFGGSMIPSLPPIIKPGDTPVKIVPKKTASAGTPSPVVAASGDRLVSREEKPVTIQSADPMPRVVTTIPVIANPADEAPLPGAMPPMPPAGAQQASAPGGPVPVGQLSAPASPPSGSKPVQTVIIKPVQPSPAQAAAAAPAPTSARAERARAPSRTVRGPQSRIASAAPLSIVPGQAGGTPARTHTAMVRGSAPASAGPMGGRYSVQVSSERSEDEARTAFHTLQAKFPQQLGQRTGLVRRANLGAKGVYYRVYVGPFASAEQASSLCRSLKAAGASCLVQRN
jgi:hypothetical protein